MLSSELEGRQAVELWMVPPRRGNEMGVRQQEAKDRAREILSWTACLVLMQQCQTERMLHRTAPGALLLQKDTVSVVRSQPRRAQCSLRLTNGQRGQLRWMLGVLLHQELEELA